MDRNKPLLRKKLDSPASHSGGCDHSIEGQQYVSLQWRGPMNERVHAKPSSSSPFSVVCSDTVYIPVGEIDIIVAGRSMMELLQVAHEDIFELGTIQGFVRVAVIT